MIVNRWVEEGHISLGTVKKFLPENIKVSGEMEKCMALEHLSYPKCQSLMLVMCNELDIDSLPTPNLCGLAERYCTELQLPGVLSSMTNILSLGSTVGECSEFMSGSWIQISRQNYIPLENTSLNKKQVSVSKPLNK